MSVWMVLRMAFKALLVKKMRTFLTMLGIIIGVAAVITMLAITTGARNAIEAKIAKLGTNVLFVWPGNGSAGGVRSGRGSLRTFTVDDLTAISKECSAVQAVSPLVWCTGQIVCRDQNWSTRTMGVSADFATIRAWPMLKGRFLDEEDTRNASRVCVLGKKVADEIFPGEDPVGTAVRLRGMPFIVVGVLTEKGDRFFGGDDCLLIPYTTAMKRVMQVTWVSFTMVSARSAEASDKAKDQIQQLLRQRHKLLDDSPDDFEIRSQVGFAQTASESNRVLTLLLGGVASLALVVGGVGIMNIMLVSVSERVREIGIRMALGARGRDILVQFLAEAIMLSLTGGLLGIGLGYALSTLAARYSSWETMVSGGSVALAFTFAAAVGVFFGVYPAVKASRLDPIEALRQE